MGREIWKMIEIDGNKAILDLNTDIYPKDCIEKAKMDFKEAAIVRGNKLESITEEDSRIVALEFCNYLIGLVKHDRN